LLIPKGFLWIDGRKSVLPAKEKRLTSLRLADGSLTEDKLTSGYIKDGMPL
jgi:hypothetical protein